MKKLFHKLFGKPIYVVHLWSERKAYIKKARLFYLDNGRLIIKFKDGEIVEALLDGKILNQPDYKEWFLRKKL